MLAALTAVIMPLPALAQANMPMPTMPSSASSGLKSSPVPPGAPLPPVNVTADNSVTSPGSKNFTYTGNVVVKGGEEFEIHADSVTGDLTSGIGDARGSVLFREIDTTVTASHLHYDQVAGRGDFENASLTIPPYTITAQRITLFANRIETIDANFTTCPDTGKPEYHVYADRIRYNLLQRRAQVRNASLYVGTTRVIKVNDIGFKADRGTDQNDRNQAFKQSIGYDGHRGPFVNLGTTVGTGIAPVGVNLLLPVKSGVSIAATAAHVFPLGPSNEAQSEAAGHKSLVALIRQFATLAGRPLPQGDPLLFHDFIAGDPVNTVFDQPVRPELVPYATLSYHEPIYGRVISNLSYSRLPELAASLDLPVLGNRYLPTDRDPVDVRRALRELYVFANANLSQGYYQEQPTGAKSGRIAGSLNFDTRPILIAPNTLFRPRVSFFEAHYSAGSSAFHYVQGDLGVDRVFSDRNLIGAEYIQTALSGHDPFVFDSVDTVSELDLRAQTGNSHQILGARVKTDLIHRHVFDYLFVAGFPQRCYIPTVTYERPSGSIGVGIEIPGVSF